jgi:pimeloyl-ACP methyl ester carboxylesterase
MISYTEIQTNGLRLHVAQAGPEGGPLIILLHGFPEYWGGWRKLYPALAEAGLRVWMPDQRGYNLSDKPAAMPDYNLDILIQDILGLIEASGQERVIVLGHDWGGVVAWWLANKHPEKVEKLIILNCPHHRVFAEESRTVWQQRLKIWYMFFFQIPRLPEFLLGLGNHAILAALMRRSSRPGSFSEGDIADYRGAWGQPGAIRAMLNWYRAMFQTKPARPDSWRIQVPTLIIWGKQDGVLRWQMAEASAKLCDSAEVVYIDEATHWVASDAPAAVSEHILRFLGQAK